jgi:ElaB/YqjD/DUF883 family membrane-anchored ribosome-binding protein
MASYRETLEEWQKTAQEKLADIDKQFGISDKLGDSAKTVRETAEKGAEVLKDGAEKVRAEAEKFAEENELGRQAKETAGKVWEASEPLRGVAAEAGEKAGEVITTAVEKAGEVLNDTRSSFEETANRASSIFGFGLSWTRTIDAALTGLNKTGEWVRDYPLKAVGSGVSVVAGSVSGLIFTGFGSHWLFSSALPVWGVKKISDVYLEYLTKQEDLIRLGELTEAEAERVKFERDIVKYVGAPLLGAFSCAAGAAMWWHIFNPARITGAPISWLLGGNPVLEGIWLFGNGVVCFKYGYEFFMVALDDHEEVQRIVKEIKGMLPETTLV